MILVLVDTPVDFATRVRAIVPDAELVHAQPGTDGFESAIRRAEIIVGKPPIRDLGAAENLKWLQLNSAGADRYAGKIGDNIVLTSASGVFGVPAAEHVFSLMLALARRIPDSILKAQHAEWDPEVSCQELFETTCCILGLGDIGAEIARRSQAFGMRVLAMKRRTDVRPEYVDEVYSRDALHEMLSESDHIVNTLPATPQTRHLIDAEALSHVRHGSYFYNIGRGATVDERALVEALKSGRLAGAGIDVFEVEPLPKSSPLWTLPNVIVTSHVGGVSPRESERVAELFLANLQRWVEGRELANVVDQRLGY